MLRFDMGGAHISATTLSLTIVWIVLCRSSNGQRCGHPGRPKFSKFDSNDFYEAGERVNYVCSNGYQLNSLSTSLSEFVLSGQRECLSNGTWSHGNIHCYRTFAAQNISCRWDYPKKLYECSTGGKLDRASELFLFEAPDNILSLNVSSCGETLEKFSYSTSTILFRFPMNRNSDTCRPLNNLRIEIRTIAWRGESMHGVHVTAYGRNGLCGNPETPANGRLVRLNETTVQHVCNPGYQLEGNEYRFCIDSFWNGTQVICSKTTEEHKSDKVYRSWDGTTFDIIATVAITFTVLAVLSIFVLFIMTKRILKLRTHSNTDACTCTTKNVKTVDNLIELTPIYCEIQDNRVRAPDHYEQPIQRSV